MLVLSRKIGEVICIGEDIEVVVLSVKGGRVKLGFAGPRDVSIRRGELPGASEFGHDAIAAAVMAKPVAGLGNQSDATVVPLRAYRTASNGV